MSNLTAEAVARRNPATAPLPEFQAFHAIQMSTTTQPRLVTGNANQTEQRTVRLQDIVPPPEHGVAGIGSGHDPSLTPAGSQTIGNKLEIVRATPFKTVCKKEEAWYLGHCAVLEVTTLPLVSLFLVVSPRVENINHCCRIVAVGNRNAVSAACPAPLKHMETSRTQEPMLRIPCAGQSK